MRQNVLLFGVTLFFFFFLLHNKKERINFLYAEDRLQFFKGGGGMKDSSHPESKNL